MVTDLAVSIRFYTQVLGAGITFIVDSDREDSTDGSIPENPVFALLTFENTELMLQERTSFCADLGTTSPDETPGGTFALYLTVDGVEQIDEIIAALPAPTDLLTSLTRTWYGMDEILIKDPDGYYISVGAPVSQYEYI